jgi:hypothetical protein
MRILWNILKTYITKKQEKLEEMDIFPDTWGLPKSNQADIK